MKIFSALLALCAGNSPVTGLDLSFDLRLGKQSWGWWFDETLSYPNDHVYDAYNALVKYLEMIDHSKFTQIYFPSVYYRITSGIGI